MLVHSGPEEKFAPLAGWPATTYPMWRLCAAGGDPETGDQALLAEYLKQLADRHPKAYAARAREARNTGSDYETLCRSSSRARCPCR